MKPTNKQLELIRSIEDALGYGFDYKNGSKEEASVYIHDHIDEYSQWEEANPFYYMSFWALTNGYL